MIDMTETIAPKSNQLNADDLFAGPRNITITDIVLKKGAEMPCIVRFDGDNGKPYFPCKTSRRVMVAVWGKDAKKYIGQSMTLWRDPTVKYGGIEMGGIRISHMTGLEKAVTLVLTETQKTKKPHTVKPLVIEAAPVEDLMQLTADAQTAAAGGVAAYQAFWKQLGKGAREALLPQHETLKATAKRADDMTDADGPIGEEMETA